MIAYLSRLYHAILDIFIPPFCLSCNIFLSEHTVLCDACVRTITPLISKTIALTATKKMRVFSVGLYEEPLKRLILSKSKSNRAVSYQSGRLLWQLTHIKEKEFDYIVPIPLHWTRYAWRGYNQAEELAKYISEQTGKPIISLLTRTKRTAYQSQFSAAGRAQNVKNAFRLIKNTDQYKNKKIILVDDVMTTGVTLTWAARELLRLRPQEITAVVLARGK